LCRGSLSRKGTEKNQKISKILNGLKAAGKEEKGNVRRIATGHW